MDWDNGKPLMIWEMGWARSRHRAKDMRVKELYCVLLTYCWTATAEWAGSSCGTFVRGEIKHGRGRDKQAGRQGAQDMDF